MPKTRYILPNIFTGLNFLIGVWAICWVAGAFQPMGGDYTKSLMMGASFIVLCVLLDKLDGFAARLMNASSEFGAQFDSLADLVAFGLAPAFALFFAYKHLVPGWAASHSPVLIMALSLYVVCAAARLAKYNALDSGAYPDYFMGMPSTFAGGLNAVVLLLGLKYDLFVEGNRFLHVPAAFLVGTAILMVSPLFLPKLKRRKSQLINAIQLINIIVTYLSGFYLIFAEDSLIVPEYLFGEILLYAVVGFGYGLMQRDKIIAEEAAKAPSA